VNTISLSERKRHLNEKYGESYRHIIGSIKRGLVRDKLSSIKSASRHLHNNPKNAAQIVARLNTIAGTSNLCFRWYPGTVNESSKLLIRNQSVGLVVKSEPGSAAEAIMMTPEHEAQFCLIDPDIALAQLSLEVRSQVVGK
jgi:hypothetical protein